MPNHVRDSIQKRNSSGISARFTNRQKAKAHYSVRLDALDSAQTIVGGEFLAAKGYWVIYPR